MLSTRQHTITLTKLKQLGTCEVQLKAFKDAFGKSVEVTVEKAVEHAHAFNWDWAASNLLTAEAWAEYQRVTAAAWAEYRRLVAPAWAEYDRVRAPALAEYQRVAAPAWAEYNRVEAAAWAEYKRVEAAAWATAYLSDENR